MFLFILSLFLPPTLFLSALEPEPEQADLITKVLWVVLRPISW